MGFNAKKTAGKITTIVEELKEKSSLALSEPEGEVYKYINVWIGNGGFANPNSFENAVVGFRVNKEWITGNRINADLIILQHFNGNGWDALPTKKLSENEEYIYFESETPSFSPFAITAGKNVMVTEEKTGENQVPSGAMLNDETGTTTETGGASQENKNTEILKIASFFVGFLIALLMGAIIIKKTGPEQEEPEKRDLSNKKGYSKR